MENYRILQRLGKGAQGSVYLAEHRNSATRIVLKKIECNDESDANQAFKEALALKKLQHELICGFKELFVQWDKELSAMFVCIVMDYYTKGDLSSVIRKMREKSEPIDELVVKKWLGQILQALLFIHKKGVIHRDLKPSNIFIQEDDGIAIGDFGVATVMADVLTRTRSTVGTLNYMAPEVLDRPHDEKTDIWSLGCVALELVTCQHADPAQMAGLLSKIKHDEQALDDVLEKAQTSYSLDLMRVVRNMLEINYRQRPSPADLAENPYIRECLTLSSDILVAKQKRQRSGRISGRAVPGDQGASAVVEFLADNLGDESSLKKGLEHLVQITKEDGTGINDDGKRIIAKVMNDYLEVEEVQVWGCQVFVNLAMTVTTNDVLYNSEVIAIVLKSMEAHPKSGTLQHSAANLIMALSADERATEIMGELRGVQNVLNALRHFLHDPSICTACLNAMWSLAVNEDNVRTLTENQGIFAVFEAMKTHSDSPELLEAACAVILSLSMEDENIAHMNTLNCVGLIIEAIQEHIVEPKLVKNACMALAAIVEPDEESAFRVLTNRMGEKEVAGIPIIMKAYHLHKDNAEVVENICILAMELLEYELICSELYDSNLQKTLLEIKYKFLSYKEILAEMKHLRMREEILIAIHRRFKENMEIMKPCESALARLGVKNPPLHQS